MTRPGSTCDLTATRIDPPHGSEKNMKQNIKELRACRA